MLSTEEPLNTVCLACKIRSAHTNCNIILSPSSGSESSYTNKVDETVGSHKLLVAV